MSTKLLLYTLGLLASFIPYRLVVQRKRWLSTFGYLLAILIAWLTIFSFDPILLLIPIVFFISSSLISKPSQKNADQVSRNIFQVWCNGGPALIISVVHLMHDHSLFMELYILSFAVANSDTWSSEIGKAFGGIPRDIFTLKRVDTGLSGGISLKGSFAGLLGSLLIASIGIIFTSVQIASTIALFGFIGMVIDSALGSLFQAKYKVNQNVLEYGTKSQLIKGYHFVTNNMVNFFSIVITVMIYYCFKTVQ